MCRTVYQELILISVYYILITYVVFFLIAFKRCKVSLTDISNTSSWSAILNKKLAVCSWDQSNILPVTKQNGNFQTCSR